MPKTRIGEKYSKKPPPIDWLLAAILERKIAYGYDLKKLARVADVSYDYMRKIITRPTKEWPVGALTNVCRAFGIKMIPTVDGSTPGDIFNN